MIHPVPQALQRIGKGTLHLILDRHQQLRGHIPFLGVDLLRNRQLRQLIISDTLVILMWRRGTYWYQEHYVVRPYEEMGMN